MAGTKELICIVCPKGCHIRAAAKGDDFDVGGNGCERGLVYTKKELTAPTRVVTSTVCIAGASLPRLPVKTDRDIPKALMLDAVRFLDTVNVKSPVKMGDVIVANILGTGANFVATRSL